MKLPAAKARLALLTLGVALLARADAGAAPVSPPAAAPPVVPVIRDAARPLPLSAVRVTGGPLRRAQELDTASILRLSPDRMLAPYLKEAGLPPKAPGYGGWDGGGRNLTGHILGHWLSAASLMGAATGDPRFRQRVEYVVSELRRAQAANGDGWVGALEGGRACFAAVAKGDVRSKGFDLNGLWAPWYTLHKLFAGLRDAYRHCGNRPALEAEVAFAGWAARVVDGMSDEDVQRMLNTEFGGMNEVLVDLYADTGEARWLALSRRFEHRAVLDPLKRHEDRLAGLHGNTQVPKLLGSLARFALTGDPADGFAAAFFWDRVVAHHSFSTGGHGKDEYFGEGDRHSDRVDGRTAESCNVYNMLKLTRRLFALSPDARYAEFHERALFNHVLASIDPEDGRTCYMVPVGRGVQHEYQDLEGELTCCVGSGLESHALHGDGIYYEAGDTLWVNLFVQSTAEWTAAGVRLSLETDFPEGESATLRLSADAPRDLTLALRRPAWAGEGFAARVNGEPVTALPPPGSFLELRRTWRTGDVLSLTLPKALRLEPLPDNPRRAAILWGPLVLAGDLGPENDFPAWKLGAVPVLVAADRPVAEWLKPVPGRPGVFRTAGVGRERDVDLVPFYRLHRRTYAVHWDLFTLPEWEAKAKEYATERERLRKLDLATVAFVQPGEMQPERDFGFRGEETQPDRAAGRACRRGTRWFSFEVPVEERRPMALVVTYYQDEWRRRTFDVLVGGVKVGEQVVEKGGVPHFFDVEYPVPAALVRGKGRVTVRFEATGGNEIAGVYGIRTVRSDAER